MIFTLKHPLAGFEDIQTMELTQIDDFFYKLQSKSPDISFTLIDPFKLRPYEFDVPIYYKILLDIEDSNKILTLTSMIISTPAENSTINFIAPLVFNMDKKYLVQVLLDTTKYPDFGITEPISNFLSKM